MLRRLHTVVMAASRPAAAISTARQSTDCSAGASSVLQASATPATEGGVAAPSVPHSRRRAAPPGAPPLAILSWSVDGPQHTHRRCRRRRSLAVRLPDILQTIRAAAPDVVALQDSTPEVAAALVDAAASDARREDPSLLQSLRSQLLVLSKWRLAAARRLAGAKAAGEGAESEEDTGGQHDGDREEGGPSPATSPSPPTVSYRLIGSAQNGRCGAMQLFVRADSPWQGRLLPANPGVTMELTCATTPQPHDSPQSLLPGRQLRFTVTNVDLSYRGKSLATGARPPLASVAVSRDGSPFSLSTGDDRHHRAGGLSDAGAVSGRHRAKGTVDAHRAIALDFLARVTRPNFIVGNFFMGKAESMPSDGKHAYADAWVMAGSPAHQERTINTFAHHGKDKVTNPFYFVPSAGLAQPRQRDETDAGAVKHDVKLVDQTDIGATLSLDAKLNRGGTWETEETTSKKNDPLAQSDSCQHSNPVPTDAWVSQQLLAENAPASVSTVGVPEVAARTQRCFVRRYAGQPAPSPNLSTDAGGVTTADTNTALRTEDPPVTQAFRRCYVMVLKAFSNAPMGPAEASWQRSHGRLRQGDTAETPAPTETTAANADDAAVKMVPCAPSDQYPLLVFFS